MANTITHTTVNNINLQTNYKIYVIKTKKIALFLLSLWCWFSQKKTPLLC